MTTAPADLRDAAIRAPACRALAVGKPAIRALAIGSAFGLLAMIDMIVGTPELRARPWSIVRLAGPVFLATCGAALAGSTVLGLVDVALQRTGTRLRLTSAAVLWTIAAIVVGHLAVDEMAGVIAEIRPLKMPLRLSLYAIALLVVARAAFARSATRHRTNHACARVEGALALLVVPALFGLVFFVVSARSPGPVDAAGEAVQGVADQGVARPGVSSQNASRPGAPAPRFAAEPTLAGAPDPSMPARGGTRTRPRILLLCLDGLEADRIERGVREGRLPTFARVLRASAGGSLATLRPTFSPRIWTTVVTGVAPARHGIEDFYLYQLPRLDLQRLRLRRSHDIIEEVLDLFGGLERVPVTSAMRRSKTVWNLADEAGLKTAVIGMWATWPPEALTHGFVVSDRASRARTQEWLDRQLVSASIEQTTHPPELAARLADLQGDPAAVTRDELAEFLTVDDALWREFVDTRAISKRTPISIFRSSHLNDAFHLRSAERLWNEAELDLCIVYARLIDDLGHFYYDLDQQLDILDRGYDWLDRRIAPLVDAVDADPRALLMITSDHGWSRSRDGYHHRDAPPGILHVYGNDVRAGSTLADASVYDIAPTILERLSLPLSRELRGRPLGDAFATPRDIHHVDRYQGRLSTSAASTPRSRTDTLEMKRLEELGYTEAR